MHSVLLLVLVGCVLGVPGIAASLVAFPPGGISLVTRTAAAFGLGYAVAGGCAFVLSSGHAFRLYVFIPVWLVASAVLWVLALRGASLRDQARAIGAGIRKDRFPLLLGALIVVAMLIVHFGFMYVLGASHVYYLNGLEIANSHGLPAATPEYGQSWPPATDKIFLDAFTGVVFLLSHNVVIGSGVLLWVATLGAALGLWASAWELGLRYTGGLLPLLVLSNPVFLNPPAPFLGASRAFMEYRAEDFGWAVAFCALALGIAAIRDGGWNRTVSAGVVLAAASGSHLIPLVVVVIALCFVGVAELLRDAGNRARLATVGQGIVVAAVGGLGGLAIRVFAGGAFGLEGASNQGGYAAIHTSFDPTAYLYSGAMLPRVAAGARRWYVPPRRVIRSMFADALGTHWPPLWVVVLVAGGALLAAILLFALVQTDLRTVGVVGIGILAAVVGVALAFDYHYHVYIDATFGIRRMAQFSSLGLILIGLGVIEALLMLLRRTEPQLAIVAVVPALVLGVWLLASSGVSANLRHLSRERLQFVNWVRAHTPCGARFLINERTEGTLTTLTGRDTLTEGMGPFLRLDKMPYVTSLMLSTRNFYRSAPTHEAFLRRHNITYVVVVLKRTTLGYPGPIRTSTTRATAAASFLHQVYASTNLVVYRVAGSWAPPISPLFKGPYLHCLTTPAHF
jgi:hypothetical protein